MLTLKNPLLLLLLSSGAESKLGEPEQVRTGEVGEAEQDQVDIWFDWSTFSPEERYIVRSDSTLNAEMTDPNTVGRFADSINTGAVDWDVVVVNNAIEINEIAETHTIVERDHVRFPISVKTEDLSKEEQRRLAESIPWGINNIFDDQLPDWDAIVGTDRSSDAIKVCVIDSGYNKAHEDLPNGADASGSFGADDNWDQDACQHGSHVAGTMLALNNNVGVVGVFPGQEPLIVKVFGGDGASHACAWTWSSNLIVAMQRCQAEGAKVINMSLGGGGYSQTANDAIDEMYNNGMLLVAAAGSRVYL